jgi:hypothetical protein
MASTDETSKAIHPALLQLLLLACHAGAMVLTFAIIFGIGRTGIHGKVVVYIAMMAAFAPATLSGFVYRKSSSQPPSSGFTWWIAFLFTLSTFGIAATATAAFEQPLSQPQGLDRMQTGGLILGIAALSILISAVLFRLGASKRKEDQDTIKRFLTHSNGRKASKTMPTKTGAEAPVSKSQEP